MDAAGKYRQRFTRLVYDGDQETTYGSVAFNFIEDWTCWGYSEDTEAGTAESEDLGNTFSSTRTLVHLRDERHELSDKDRLQDVDTEEEYLISGIVRDIKKRELLVICGRYEGPPAPGEKH